MTRARKRPPKPAPSRGRRVWRLLKWSALLALLAGVLATLGGAWAYQRHVVEEPGHHVSREAILEIIAQESPVLYRDGKTRLGVFFAREHRQYVPYEEIPQAWVDAIVAAEDQRFFEHHGIDPRGIARAMLQNLRAGRVVAGGSTLTQQTAKNLYYRPDRSMRSKWEEAVNALRLEAHHPKTEILEYYANQFHVSANGRGLGIAARYFFDKEPGALTTLECAYLAGMVKAPAAYNPFLGKSEERRQAAYDRALARTRYVLDRMRETGKLSRREHDRLKGEPIPFKRGTFRYDSSVLLDEVALRLEQSPFPEIFAELGIDNPSTAGIRVVTTLDVDAQREATYALWHHLTEAGPLIEGQTAAALRLGSDQAPSVDTDNPPPVHGFSNGTVTNAQPGSAASLVLDLGGHTCSVDHDGLFRMATVLARARKAEGWRQASQADVDALVGALPRGTVVWASLREPGVCDLELRPELQGAALLLQDGQIRALVGGNDNRNFNRAVTARRQLGSTWKPLVYFAALQLGWSPVDVLDNRKNVFVFEGTWYYPRPDHESEDRVSLAWAGTRSENLASIWLLAHLTDRLDPARFRQVAELVGLTPGADEDRMAFIRRIRDDYGVIATRERLPEAAFEAARAEVLASLSSADQASEALDLGSLSFGRGAETEEARLRRSESGAALAQKLRAVRANFLRLEELGQRCATRAESLHQLAQDGEKAAERGGFAFWRKPGEPPPVPPADRFDGLSVRSWYGTVQLGCGEVDANWGPVGEELLAALAAGEGLPLGEVDEMWVDGRLRYGTVRALRRAMQRQMLVLQGADPYDLDALQYHPDYRALVNMRYVALLAARLGVRTELPPVLSLPLGAVDISLEEAASMYQGMLRGQIFTFPGKLVTHGAVAGLRSSTAVPSPEAPTMLIAEIRDRDDNLLYRAEPAPVQVAPAAAGREIGGILRDVVQHGTGRRALSLVTLGGQAVPVAGKTGTTNGYKNAAFSGFVPRAAGGAWRWGEGYTLSVYVGYDDNRPMRRGSVRLQGASGALPAWVGTAAGLAGAGLLGETPPADPEWVLEEGFVAVPVRATDGRPGVSEGDEAPPTVVVQGAWDGEALEVTRRFSPVVPAGGVVVEEDAETVGVPAPAEAPPEQPASDAVPDEYREIWVDGMEAPVEDIGRGVLDTGLVPRIEPDAAP